MGRARSPLRETLEYLAFRAGLGALGALPGPLADAAGGGLGWLAYHLLGRRRRIALANLELVWGQRLGATERRRIARRSMQNLGRLVAEFARIPRIDRRWLERHVRFEGHERYRQARERGRGVLILAAHFGSWEMIPVAQALLGYPMAFIVRPADNARIEATIRSYRERNGNRAIAKQEALRECLRRLKGGETVGLLIDQHVPADRGVESRFLGQPTHTSSALAALALRTEAPILPMFALREAPGRLAVMVGPEVELALTGDGPRDLLETTERCNRVVESFIERHPDHWLWAHRRFRRGGRAAGPEAGRASLTNSTPVG